MCALLVASKISLEWADNQYWCTLSQVVTELVKYTTPKKKEKVSASEMQNFIQ